MHAQANMTTANSMTAKTAFHDDGVVSYCTTRGTEIQILIVFCLSECVIHQNGLNINRILNLYKSRHENSLNSLINFTLHSLVTCGHRPTHLLVCTGTYLDKNHDSLSCWFKEQIWQFSVMFTAYLGWPRVCFCQFWAHCDVPEIAKRICSHLCCNCLSGALSVPLSDPLSKSFIFCTNGKKTDKPVAWVKLTLAATCSSHSLMHSSSASAKMLALACSNFEVQRKFKKNCCSLVVDMRLRLLLL